MLLVPGVVSFAAELDQARTTQRVSFVELARRSGYAQSYLFDLTQGRRTCRNMATIERLSEALEVDPAIFTSYRQFRVCSERPDAIDRLYQFHFEAGAA
jgi:transcriptional regulator with XRE-family HTH domain